MELDADVLARCTPWLARLREPAPPRPPAELALPLGWQLKHLAQAAWSTDPPRVREHASALQALQALHPSTTLAALGRWTEGLAALAEGQCEDALASLRAARAAFDALGQALSAAQTRVPCTVALGMLGRPTEALAEAEEALAQFIQLGDERAAGKLELNIGTLLLRDERAGLACQHYRRAAVRFARVGDAELSVMADIALANALTQQCALQEAAFVNERARRRAQAQGLTLLAAHAEAAIGRIALQRGDPATALPPLARARSLLAKGGAAPQRLLEADEALADAHASAGLVPEALAMFTRLADDASRLGAQREAQRARLRQARLLARAGQSDAALQSLARLEADAALPPAQRALALLVRAEALAGEPGAAAEAARAEAALAKAELPGLAVEARLLRAQSETPAAEEWPALLQAASLLPGLHARARWLHARALAEAGDRAGACAELDAALDWSAAQRDALGLDEFRSAAARELDSVACLRLRLAREAGEAPGLLFQRIERLRSQMLPPAGPPAAVDAPERQPLLQAQARAQAALQAGDLPLWQQRLSEQRRLERDWLERWRRDALSRSPGSETRAAPPDEASLDAALEDSEAWLHWQLDAPGEGARLLALLRWQGAWHCVEFDAAGVRRALADVQFQFEALRAGRAHWQAHAAELTRRAQLRLRTLHRLLWAPLAPLLAGCRQLVMAPHAELNAVPWAALHDGEQALCERLRVRLAASATRWCLERQRVAEPGGEVLALGACGAQDADLPAVRAELQTLQRAQPQARVLQDGEATQVALRAHAPQARLLHLAGHACLRDDNPSFSHLLLGDGPLHAHELAGVRLRPGACVVLSACDGARGLRSLGHEPLGLLRALHLAGARAVLASPWSLDDEATARWMGRFYAAWSAGLSLSAATQQAQQQAARAGDHPALWGGFAVHGPD